MVDFCMRVPAADIRAFMEKWGLDGEDAPRGLTQEQELKIELENPLLLHFTPQLALNGRPMPADHSCSLCYNPCLPEGMENDPEGKQALEHYRLDPSAGWTISRMAFPWAHSRRPAIKSLSLTMEQQPASLPGLRFRPAAPGEKFPFTHPTTGQTHTLTVESLEQGTLLKEALENDRWEYPTHFLAMQYTLSPALPENTLSVRDCAQGDRPREKAPAAWAPTARAYAAVSIGIIGGADGPTAVFLSFPAGEKARRTAFSSLYFAPVEQVEWLLVFHEKRFADMTFPLLF